ncbi:2-oxoglutarate dehydrogenase E1 component [Priestia koreensis]|uniref:2-oxoglutarate dehydrogenase E1 component n=1 Tax=Priestia koreensis TaxID=284581 RepID=UPI001F585007|nr:2-oxoglutarate dehydrogenase E1 component [Priestia koreensis]UNL86610.1 2-oxoglutarate dehydrogenase E1 component [Priestia koreensis]
MYKQTTKGDEPWQKFLGPNLGYVMDMYEHYVNDPESVDPELKELFEQYGPPTASETAEQFDRKASHENANESVNQEGLSNVYKVAAAVKLAENIRTYGHLYADIYPLHNNPAEKDLLQLDTYDLTEADLKAIPVNLLCKNAPELVQTGWDAIQYLKALYTKAITFEFQHVHEQEENAWLTEMVESGSIFRTMSTEKKSAVLERLTEVEEFEKFLHKTFVGQKRFSVEGLDVLIPVLDEIVAESVQVGAKNINIGMAHRGRLNVLAHVLGKPYEAIFAEFQHAPNKELVPSEGSTGINYGWSGDVKYHLGADRQIKHDRIGRARLTLANNPSHLEFVNPVVEGFTRAAQEERTKSGFPTQDVEESYAILIHGDAAFPGEGIVAETLNMSRLRGYQTGGTIHIIANNMIGFTTESYDSRSTKYASDLAKGYEIPIVHVNADNPEACLAAAYFAYEYRKRFNKDFLIDLIGYRRFGHNEMDEPSTTQPKLYEIVRKHPTVREIYATKLQEQQALSAEKVEEINQRVQNKLQTAYDKVPNKTVHSGVLLPVVKEQALPELPTAVDADTLQELGEHFVQWPENFKVFPKLARILERRSKALKEDGKIDWSLGEALAFATILQDGTPIRITGQDSERGTFAQRNIMLHDMNTNETYSPLHKIPDVNATFAVHNSPLSEGSVIGFEYGYNVFAPETLVLWEAQFGDFANAGQVLFDQFISAGEAKWGQKSGMVLLLPHAYEGQGPEHSSGRLERYLQSAAENNWTVANVTTAAQYFHLLRRQAAVLNTKDARPLVVMTPKSLLRNPNSVSDLGELTAGSFQAILEEPLLGKNSAKVERVVLGSGKITVDLKEAVQEQAEELDWVHILRVEEIYPFPAEQIKKVLSRFDSLKEIVWVQEEPANMGSWSFAEPRIHELAPEGVKVSYVGRERRSSTAEGDPTVHKKEQQRIIDNVLTRQEITIENAVTR